MQRGAEGGDGQIGEEEQGPIYRPHAGYEAGLAADFDREFAIDRAKFWRFLEDTQAEELAKLSDRPNWQRLVLERLNRKIQKNGILSVLKKGLAIDDAHLTLLYSLPYNDTNPTVRANFYKNIFSVTRQVYYSDRDPNLSIDMVVFLNGLAIATLELKNRLVRPDRLPRQKAVPRRPRSERTFAPVCPLHCPLCRGYRRSVYDHPAGRQKNLLSAV